MKDTVMKSTLFMQPQYRNRHSYMIFGGYLLRQTFELAYCTAATFSWPDQDLLVWILLLLKTQYLLVQY